MGYSDTHAARAALSEATGRWPALVQGFGMTRYGLQNSSVQLMGQALSHRWGEAQHMSHATCKVHVGTFERRWGMGMHGAQVVRLDAWRSARLARCACGAQGGVKQTQSGKAGVRDVPVHELRDPRVADPGLVGDLLPFTSARLQRVSNGDIKGGAHGASVAKFCDLSKQHFATSRADTVGMEKKSTNQILAEALAFFLAAQGWNYTTLGRKAGIAANTIKNYCTKREASTSGKERSAKIAEVEQLAAAMDLQFVDLVSDASENARRLLLRKRAAEYYETTGKLPHWAPGQIVNEGGGDEASPASAQARRSRTGA